MPQRPFRGPWETTPPPHTDKTSSGVDTRLLLHALIRPNRTSDKAAALALSAFALVGAGLSLAFAWRGQPVVSLLFALELTGLALATRACRRSAADRVEEIFVFPDRLEVRTRIGGQTACEGLPTAWLTLDPPSSEPGLILRVHRRRIRIASWLGAAQRDDLHDALEMALATTRRGGLAVSAAVPRLWCSRSSPTRPVDPSVWTGSAGQI